MRLTKRFGVFPVLALVLSVSAIAPFLTRTKAAAEGSVASDAPSLTIYNQRFAVVRQVLPLDLSSGVSHAEVTDISSHLEPDSVILRPLDSSRRLQVLEQNYRNDPVTQQLLLSLYEGKTISFLLPDGSGGTRTVQGRIIRSGYVPHYNAYSTYGQQYYQAQAAYIQAGSEQPIIEVNGQLQFSLPGQPIFPALADDTILKTTLSWKLQTDKPGRLPAEFSYVTGGMNWEASYNVVAPPNGNLLELVGWVTLDNQSGKTFQDARIKLMAGDVNKLQPGASISGPMASISGRMADNSEFLPAVTERSFDEYHLYTLERPTTLHDRETKQVEFIRASGIESKTVYIYDGFKFDPAYRGWSQESIRQQENFGLSSNSKVWAMQEFKNSKENHLGMPLPMGRVRFYRRDVDGQLQFTGENQIDHTPENETLRLYTGNAFDLTGGRRRVQYRLDSSARWVDENFEIKVRNHKKTPVEVRVVEHLYRWTNWEITQNSNPFHKTDSQTMEFILQIPPDGERTISYQVHYTW